MNVDDADDENENSSLHSVHTGITTRTVNTTPSLVPGTDDVISSGTDIALRDLRDPLRDPLVASTELLLS